MAISARGLKKRNEAISKALRRPQSRRRLSRAQKRRWREIGTAEKTRILSGLRKIAADRDALEKRNSAIKKACMRPETKKRKAPSLEALRSDPKIQKRRIRAIRKAYKRPEMRQWASGHFKSMWAERKRLLALGRDADRGPGQPPGESAEMYDAAAKDYRPGVFGFRSCTKKHNPKDWADPDARESAVGRMTQAIKTRIARKDKGERL